MKKLCTKWFKKWAKKMRLENHHLIEAIGNLEKGLSAANLGSNLFKVRVNREGQGKSSGFRTIIAYKKEDKTIFLYGFGKNERANIDKAELHYFKKLGSDLMIMDAGQIEKLIAENVLFDLEE
ncbi:MAG: type II toxin-antitoxin system RelE/ParE family toxin [Desulfobacterales bacterium]|nr:type II toxin-antitoxin system RelE/ParE family toxin [Desulfobacterales bacterium]